MKKQILSEEFRRMQKLAGLITESQLNDNDLKLYYKVLEDIGGQDLAGNYEDILLKSKKYKSISDFIKSDLEILSQDDEDQVNDIKFNFVSKKIRKMSPEEFTSFVERMGDYDFWSNTPEGIDPFNNIGQRMDVLSNNTLEDNNKYFDALI